MSAKKFNIYYLSKLKVTLRTPLCKREVASNNLRLLQTLVEQVCTFHDGCKQGIDQQIFNRKSISRKITHPQS